MASPSLDASQIKYSNKRGSTSLRHKCFSKITLSLPHPHTRGIPLWHSERDEEEMFIFSLKNILHSSSSSSWSTAGDSYITTQRVLPVSLLGVKKKKKSLLVLRFVTWTKRASLRKNNLVLKNFMGEKFWLKEHKQLHARAVLIDYTTRSGTQSCSDL